MQVFKLFFKIVKTKWIAMLIYLAIFLAILTLTDVSGSDSGFTSEKMALTLYDKDNTEASKKLVDYISANNDMVEVEDDKDKLIDALYITATNYVITINEGFSEKLAKGETEGLFEARYIHDSNTNKLADDMLDSYVSTVNAMQASGMELSEAQDAAVKVLSEKTEVEFETFSEDTSAKSAGFFNYMPYIIMSLVVSSLCPVIIVMNNKEVAFRTKCSSYKESRINFQTILAAIVFMFVIWIFLMGLGVIKNEGIFTGNLWFAVLNTIAFMIVCIAIAILLSTFGVSETALGFISQTLGLGMAFLCGMFVPLELLSKSVVAIGRFLPAYWYVRANNMICNMSGESFSLSKVMSFMGVELLFAAAIFAVAIAVRKQKKSI